MNTKFVDPLQIQAKDSESCQRDWYIIHKEIIVSPGKQEKNDSFEELEGSGNVAEGWSTCLLCFSVKGQKEPVEKR